jgi:hypothetical protein
MQKVSAKVVGEDCSKGYVAGWHDTNIVRWYLTAQRGLAYAS